MTTGHAGFNALEDLIRDISNSKSDKCGLSPFNPYSFFCLSEGEQKVDSLQVKTLSLHQNLYIVRTART